VILGFLKYASSVLSPTFITNLSGKEIEIKGLSQRLSDDIYPTLQKNGVSCQCPLLVSDYTSESFQEWHVILRAVSLSYALTIKGKIKKSQTCLATLPLLNACGGSQGQMPLLIMFQY